jgi:putative hydrolase of the HAD superfamily
MKKKTQITTIFTDLGGVILTNGWDRHARAEAVELFGLDAKEMEERHHLTFDTYEVGKLTLHEYLERVVFYKKRKFTEEDFSKFMYKKSQAYDSMITLMKKLKKKYGLKIAVVNNEGRELNDYRIKKFKLGEFVDFFISSSFVHFRKPDVDIFKLALDVAQTPVRNIVYLDDRALFVQVAEGLGIRGIEHTDYASTVIKLKALGLEV